MNWVEMGRTSVMAGMAAAALMGAAASAHAQAKHDTAADFTALSDQSTLSQPWSIPTPHKTIQLDSKGRWGVRLDVEQPSGRDTQLKDVQAGAYVAITPRIRIGGSVGLGDKFAQPQRLTPEDTAPRVHLETKFKF